MSDESFPVKLNMSLKKDTPITDKINPLVVRHNLASYLHLQHVIQERRIHLKQVLATICIPGQSHTVEMGCGHGHFLTAYAQAHPHQHCLGIDIMNNRVMRAQKKSQNSKLANLWFLKAEATDLLTVWPDHIDIERVFILFPDPWPKRRHQHHRLMQPSFMDHLKKRLGLNSRVYLRTDDVAYAKATQAMIEKSDDWVLEDSTSWPFERPTIFQLKAHHAYCSMIFKKKA